MGGAPSAAGASSLPYSGPLAGTPTLVTLANGAVVPSDIADIKAAKLAHSQSGGAIVPATGVSSSAGLSYSAGASSAIVASSPLVTYAAEPVVFTGLVAHPNGALVPADNADVKAAKLAHAQVGGVLHSVAV